jgi:hypothetical protein
MSNNDDPFATEPEAVPVDVPAEQQPEPAKEPNKRLTMKQGYQLTVYCQTVPSRQHETWVAFAAAASETLGFRVTEYSLKLALEAAERDEAHMLKTPQEVSLGSLKSDIDKLTVRLDAMQKIVDMALGQLSFIQKL